MISPRPRTTYLFPPVGAPNAWVAAGLLLLGAALVAYAGGTGWRQETNWWRYKVAIVVALLGVLPPVNRSVAWVLRRLRRPGVRGAAVIAITIALLATNYFIFTGLRQGREFIPKLHDEHVYLLQAQMAARGKLWMPGLPLPDFFETFYVFVHPLYAPVYFPGTALFYAPTVWFGISPFIWAAWICGAVVGMTYRVLVELIDGIAALLGALLMLALPTVHLLSLMVMSHTVSLLLGLAMVWAWLRWSRRRRVGWVAVMGLLAGWAAVTRPFDALCFAIPIAIAVLREMRRQSWRTVCKTVAAGCLSAVPFLALQFSFDRAVTGHLFKTPVTRWDHLYAPQWEIGAAAPDANFRLPSQLPEMQQFYREFVVTGVQDIANHGVLSAVVKNRLPDLLWTVVPVPLILLFAPLGLVGLGEWKRCTLFLGLPLSVVLYAFYPLHLSYYALIAAPAALMLVVMGVQALANAFRAHREQAEVVVAMALAAVSLTSLSELNPWLNDLTVTAPVLVDVEHKLSEITRPAVVLFHFEPGNDANEEPVYNIMTPWPDDAQVIRAHDLGIRNIELFRYYANRSPHRMIYLYDENTLELRELGMADALARESGERIEDGR